MNARTETPHLLVVHNVVWADVCRWAVTVFYCVRHGCRGWF